MAEFYPTKTPELTEQEKKKYALLESAGFGDITDEANLTGRTVKFTTSSKRLPDLEFNIGKITIGDDLDSLSVTVANGHNNPIPDDLIGAEIFFQNGQWQFKPRASRLDLNSHEYGELKLVN